MVSDAGYNWRKLWWPDTTTRPSLQTDPNNAAWAKDTKCGTPVPVTNTPAPSATRTPSVTPGGPTLTASPTQAPSQRQAIFYFADWGAVPQFGGTGMTPVPGSILEVADIVPFVNKITVINYAFIAPDQNGDCYFITPASLTHVGKAPIHPNRYSRTNWRPCAPTTRT
jgi:hypothetical protein